MQRLTLALADRYRIERELGAGGMATVYLAEDLKHQRKVALKVLRPELAAVIGAERFLSEIRTTANLQHPHILPLHDSGEVDGTVYYVMPFVSGESLRDRLTREKQLPIAEAVRITTETAGALDYAHRHGVIHRDIKPENILLHDGSALVADFGIALAASRTDGGTRLTETGMSLGTPHYMSPEQAMGERDLDARTDVYALGCVLYEMLTGEPPFTGPSAQAIVAKVMTATPEPVTTYRKTVPPHVADAVHTALQKLPADRFATAAEFAASLGDAARINRGSRHAGKPLTPMQRLRQALPFALASLAVGALGMFWLRGAGEPPAAPAPAVRFTIPTTGPGEESAAAASLAIAPDGQFFIYAASRNGVTALYRRDLDDPQPKALPGTESASWPAVSPDGQSLAFVASDGSLRTLRFDGSRPRVLRPMTNPPIGLTWSRSAGLVLGMLAYSTTSGLSRVALDGDTTIHPVTRGADSGRGMHHFPFALDAAGVVLFQDIEARSTWLGVAPLSGGTPQNLDLPLQRIVGYAEGILAFIGPGGSLMAVQFDAAHRKLVGSPVAIGGTSGRIMAAALAANGSMVLQLRPADHQVLLVDETGTGKPLIPDTLRAAIPRFSPDGKTVALAISRPGNSRIETYDLASGTRATVSQTTATALEWMPDGRRLLTVNGPAQAVTSWPADGSGRGTTLLRVAEYRLRTAAPSPDGRTVVIGTVFDSGGQNVATSPLDSVATMTPFAAGAANEFAPRFSPDGHWIAYVSDESGRSEVYLRPFPGPGARIQVSTTGGGEPVWAHDGSRLFYGTGGTLMFAPITRSSTGALQLGERRQLFAADFTGNADFDTAHYDVSPDGHHFLIVRAVGGGQSEIAVWLHWLGDVKTQFAAQQRR